jgi:hypothetical protein
MEEKNYPISKQRPGSFGFMMQQVSPPITGRPITARENMLRVFKKEKPVWMPAWLVEVNYCWPDVVLEHSKYEYDGFDWYGTEWVWVEIAGGMMVKPGTRTISNITKWKEELVFPDLEAIDWESDAKEQTARYDPDKLHLFHLTEGMFERLHELIPFEEALEAIIEEKECVLEFFDAVAEFKMRLLDKIFTYYAPIDYIIYGDDWGTQRSGFFSNEMFEEMIYPSTKKLLSFVKSRGKYIELHSCGLNEQYVPYMIDMGIDMWTPQAINDSDMLKEKYGDKMAFCFAVKGLDAPDITEEKARKIIREFVDKYAPGGRTMAQIFMTDPKIQAIALDELYKYSLEYYKNNK